MPGTKVAAIHRSTGSRESQCPRKFKGHAGDIGMSKDVLHVVPQGESWAIKREGNERSSSIHDTQKDAIDSAHNLADDGDDIVIHRADGTIRNRVTSVGIQNGDHRNQSRSTVKARDVLSVGARVSWPAVLAGVAVAFTVYLLL